MDPVDEIDRLLEEARRVLTHQQAAAARHVLRLLALVDPVGTQHACLELVGRHAGLIARVLRAAADDSTDPAAQAEARERLAALSDGDDDDEA